MSCRGSREVKAMAKLNTMATEARVAVIVTMSVRVDRVTPEMSMEARIAIGPKGAWDEARLSLRYYIKSRAHRHAPVIWMHGQAPLHLLRRGQHAALPQPRQTARADCNGEASYTASVAGVGAADEAGIRRGLGQRQS